MWTRWPLHEKLVELLPSPLCKWERLHTLVHSQRKHLPCPHCPTWVSHSGTVRNHIQRFPTSRLAPSRVLSELNFSEADAVEEGRRSRRRGPRSSGARQRRLYRREPKVVGSEEFTILHSNVRGFISRVAELSARLRLLETKALPTMRTEG